MDDERTDSMPELTNPFLEGNELIEQAIAAYHESQSDEDLFAVMDALVTRMRADGHLMLPVGRAEGEEGFFLRTVQGADGNNWVIAFTSPAEYERGPQSEMLSQFIDALFRQLGEMGAPGVIINPWGKSLTLTSEMVADVLAVSNSDEYTVPDDDLTPELLADGSYLQRALAVCERNPTQLNEIKLLRILRASNVVVPCRMVLSEEDQAAFEQAVAEAQASGKTDEPLAFKPSNEEAVQMVPQVINNGEITCLPAFSSPEAIRELKDGTFTITCPFVDAIALARDGEDVAGIVVNPFTEPYVVRRELFDMVEGMPPVFGTQE